MQKILIILFWTQFAQAAQDMIYLDRDLNNDLNLRLSIGCSVLSEQIKALTIWTQNTGHPVSEIPSVQLESDGSCVTKIQSIVPDFANPLLARTPKYHGPNCWNTTLRALSMNTQSRFASESEMTFWMKSKFCRELGENESPQPGDAIAMRTLDLKNKMTEMHGMIYVSPYLGYSKNTSHNDSEYSLTSLDEVYLLFRIYEKECRQIKGQKKNCYRWANYYRCQNPSEKIASARASNLLLDQAYQKFNDLDLKISEMALNDNKYYLQNLKQIRLDLDDLILIITPQLKIKNASTFYWQALNEAVLSDIVQVDLIRKYSTRP